MSDTMPESIEGFALSPQQRRAWSLRQASGKAGAPFGVEAVAVLSGELDRDRLERAVRSVVARHEILRTAFRLVPGMTVPVQVVREEPAAPIDWQELLGMTEAEAIETALAGLDAAPMLKVSVASLAPDRHLVAVGLPALAADAASVQRLLEEIGRGYFGTAEEETPPTIQYADVAQIFNDLLESDDTEAGRESWHRFDPAVDPKAWSAGVPPFPRPAAGETGFDPARLELATPLDPAGGAVVLAGRLGVEEQAVWLACWSALLARLSGVTSLVAGVSFGGREFEGLDTAQGPFARLLPVGVEVLERSSFCDFVREIGLSLRSASERQDYFRWEDLAAGAPEARRFALAFEQGLAWSAPAHGLRLVARRSRLEPFVLRFDCARDPDGALRAELGWDRSLVSDRDAESLARCFAALAESALAAPDLSVGDLEVLDAAACGQLAAWGNGASNAAPAGYCLHELFEAQADRTPNAPAVLFEGESLTYSELEARANRLAWHLRTLGVGPESRVGVCLERSPSLPVALLAVLKAGGAYVPLDPSYPRERLAGMVEDAGLALLLTEGSASSALGAGENDVRQVPLDAEPSIARFSRLPDHRPAPLASPENLAYLIYTSGSTGRPKAVLMPHCAIANRLLWMQEAFPLAAGDAVLQKTPFSFDASIWEIFLPLFVGARVVLVRPGGEKDAGTLLRAVAENGISVLQLVPSHLGALIQDDRFASSCRGLTRLFCGGEALPWETARWVRELGVAVCNLYGPTEGAIDATFFPVEGEAESAIVPIGRPIHNVRIHLVDRELRRPPAGIPGELLIGGAGLSRGYFGRPDLSAERFVPDPFAAEPGGRLYRTGDLARFRPDGAIEFLGRIDDQLKIRGFRIEPGEVAAAVARHRGVREAAVAAWDNRLVAYVVPDDEVGAIKPFLAELLHALRTNLPEHLAPAEIVPLPALPRSPSGKLDRKALPSPAAFRSEGEPGAAAPRTPVEEILAGILGEVLGRERIDLRAGYLELGGHSLLAMQVASKVRAAFGVELQLRSLFEIPTLAEVAALIEVEMRAGRGLVAPPLVRASRDRELPLSFAQQRLWFLYELAPDSPYFNSSIALRAAGRLDPVALASAFREICRRHEVLRTTFSTVAGRPAQHIGAASTMALPGIDLAALPAERQEAESRRLAAGEAKRPFDLGRGPLLRVARVALAGELSLILFTMHHITGDGWSTGILCRELSALYGAFACGLPSPLPGPSLQYADFAAWQRGWLDGDVLAAQISWWREQLAGSPPTLSLGTDRPRPAVQSSRGARIAFEWPADLAAGLQAIARRERATIFMVVMATFQSLLHFRSGQDDLVVGTDVANRNRVETEGLIGFFVNQLPLRARFAAGMTFRDLLLAVRERSLGAYGHQDLPFEKMVEALSPERSSEHAPLFQVKLNLQNVPPVSLDLPGLTLSRLELHKGTSQLDLIVNVEEGDSALRGSLEYNSDLWNEGSMEELLADFEALLSAYAARPEMPLAEARASLAAAADRRGERLAQEFADISLRNLRQRARRTAVPGVAV